MHEQAQADPTPTAPTRTPRSLVGALAISAVFSVAVGAMGLAAAMFAADKTTHTVVAHGAVLLVYLVLAVASGALSFIDVRAHRLPNRIVVPLYPVVVLGFLVAAIADADLARWWTALACGGIAFAFFFLLRSLERGMGGGDVKVAGVLGIALGWVGWEALMVGLASGFLLGGLAGGILLLTGRVGRRDPVPFGPALLAGAWIGVGAGIVLTQ